MTRNFSSTIWSDVGAIEKHASWMLFAKGLTSGRQAVGMLKNNYKTVANMETQLIRVEFEDEFSPTAIFQKLEATIAKPRNENARQMTAFRARDSSYFLIKARGASMRARSVAMSSLA